MGRKRTVSYYILNNRYLRRQNPRFGFQVPKNRYPVRFVLFYHPDIVHLVNFKSLTHGPPFGILDDTNRRDKAGCASLTNRLPSLRPRVHVFGHIHEAHGAEIRAWDPHFTAVAEIQSTDDKDMFVNTQSDNNEMCELRGTIPESEAGEGVERTVFVNASNWPSGPRSRRDGKNVGFGGKGFQPVIVDLKDNV